METIKNIYQYRYMIANLVKKELRGRYKRTVLGFLWTFINPLLQLGVYTFVFSYIMDIKIEKFYLFLFVALVPWIFFSTSVTSGAMSIVSEKNLVQKIFFPKQVLPIALVTTNFINMIFGLLIVIVICAIEVGISWQALVYLPLVMAAEYFLCLGIALITSCLTVYFRDLEHILGILTMIWMYLTPIMYSFEMVPEGVRGILRFNLMVPIIVSYREILYYKNIPEFSDLLQTVVYGLVVIIFGNLVFKQLEKRFAEEL